MNTIVQTLENTGIELVEEKEYENGKVKVAVFHRMGKAVSVVADFRGGLFFDIKGIVGGQEAKHIYSTSKPKTAVDKIIQFFDS